MPDSAPETAPAAPPAAPPEPAALLPFYIAKLPAAGPVVAAVEAARVAAELPSLSLVDYRFVLGRPGGNPFSIPVTVIYRPGTDAEQQLGTYRIALR